MGSKRVLCCCAPFVLCLAITLLIPVPSENVETKHTVHFAPVSPPLAQQTPAPLEQLVDETVAACNADLRNNKKGHVGCVVIKDAIVTGTGVHYDPLLNPSIPRQFPPLGATRHHMKPIRLTADLPSTQPATSHPVVAVGYYQSPVIGAQWENAWHTIADFFVMLHHTIAPLLHRDVSVTWFTRTAQAQLGKGCSEERTCRRMSLFDPFSRLFNHRVVFVQPDMEPVRVAHLVIGLNTRCSPIPTENVGAAECQSNIRDVRAAILRAYNISLERIVLTAERACPTVHVMSRQGDKYRHVTPFDELVDQLRSVYQRTFPRCGSTALSVVKIDGKMSFREQILSVYSHSVLFAGRGGGTALSIFLPEGGLYISLSGFDRWSPYRDLVPAWITLEHIEVSLVHHEDFRRPPQWFGSGKNRYIDPNRAAYLVKPGEVAEKAVDMIARWSAI